MDLKSLTLNDIIERLNAHNPFLLLRYGDGEWLDILGRDNPNWTTEHALGFEGLQQELRTSLSELEVGPDTFLTIVAPRHIKRLGLGDSIVRWLSSEAPQTHSHWYDGQFLTKASVNGELHPFIEALREQRLLIIGPPHVKHMAHQLPVARFLEIPPHDCYREYDRILAEAIDRAPAPGGVITLSAGMVSEALGPALYDALHREVTVMDVGSLWDPFCGVNSRSFHERVAANAQANLTGKDTPMETRTIAIISRPRTISSALAGALEKLGVNMGGRFQQPRDPLNPRGYFEDRRWQRVLKNLTGKHYRLKTPNHLPERYRAAFAKLIQDADKKHDIWGVKNPRLCLALPHLLDLFTDLRVIHLERDWQANVESLVRHSEMAYNGQLRMTPEQAEAKLTTWDQAVLTAIKAARAADVPVYEANGADIINDPATALQDIADFVFGDYFVKPTAEQMEAAVRWIDPDLEHFSAPAEPESVSVEVEPPEPVPAEAEPSEPIGKSS